ncbi:hypothetical protein FE257_004739 [Aspergillus nanangensis]|uniref:Uncharacterized protein n=1 Tax=Aspergillus nanangensis TaxID=2582783 RepID=A0AAD4GW00_ASPNN|nr:hypothetical protein FE257_004739 [Aspergillus nanangensis]
MTATLSMCFSPRIVLEKDLSYLEAVPLTGGCLPDGMYNSAPDTPSPVYPDRLIRPLPKRTLRSRLPSESTDGNLYPSTPSATQLFYGSCADDEDGVNDSKVYVQQSDGQEHSPERDHYLPYENGVDLESGDEDGPVVVRRSAGFRGSSLSPSASSSAHHPNNGDVPPTKSSTANPDGYDAFENTNNKKKRKIPTPGNLGGHHSTLSPEFSTMGLANATQTPSTVSGEGSHVSTFYGTGSPASPVGSGMSGAGRGRLGRNTARNSAGRASLSVQTQFGWPQSRAPGRRDDGGKSDQGIISAAIANAAASAFSSPPRGSGSMLDQPPTTPTKTQFTFTCESDSSKGMALQPQNPYSASQRQQKPYSGTAYTGHASPSSPMSPQGHPSQNRAAATMTSTAATANALANVTGNAPTATATATASTSTAEPPNAGRKKKRSPASIYALAARQRKIQQQYSNLHHSPSMEDIWICEFCEYESIFGHPPEALIRQYEIKDRKERKRLAEKKRLLEKAKMKGRKNKKATKNAAKNAAAHQPAYEQGYDRASVDQAAGTHEDNYPGHDYEEEPEPAPPGPPTHFKPPLPPEHQPTTTGSVGGAKGATDWGSSRPP